MCISASELGSLKSGCESCSALYHLGALDWTCLCPYFPICKMGVMTGYLYRVAMMVQ